LRKKPGEPEGRELERGQAVPKTCNQQKNKDGRSKGEAGKKGSPSISTGGPSEEKNKKKKRPKVGRKKQVLTRSPGGGKKEGKACPSGRCGGKGKG